MMEGAAWENSKRSDSNLGEQTVGSASAAALNSDVRKRCSLSQEKLHCEKTLSSTLQHHRAHRAWWQHCLQARVMRNRTIPRPRRQLGVCAQQHAGWARVPRSKAADSCWEGTGPRGRPSVPRAVPVREPHGAGGTSLSPTVQPSPAPSLHRAAASPGPELLACCSPASLANPVGGTIKSLSRQDLTFLCLEDLLCVRPGKG